MAKKISQCRFGLRCRITVVFVLAIVLFGASATLVSRHILTVTLAREGLSENTVRHITNGYSRMLSGVTVAGTSIAVFMAILLSRTITRPLRRLLAGVEEISAGHLDAHIDAVGDSELRRLADAFNDMARKLKLSHDHLEAMVDERTAELSQRNDELQTQIAERWRAEEQLRRSEERFVTMANCAQDAIMMMDPSGHITFYNRAAGTLFGWSATEAMGKDLHTLIAPPTYREAFCRGLSHFRRTGEGPAIGKTLELTALRKDGTEFPIEISLAGVELNHEWHAIGIVRDITERKRIEEALRGSEQRLQDILDSILTGVFIIDPKTHTILDVNESAARQVGLPKSEIVGTLCHDFVSPAECGKCPITDMGQTMDRSERILLRSDGEAVPIIKSVTRATFQEQECLIESFVPIKQQKEAEAGLKESLSLLEATLEATADGIVVTDTQGAYKHFNGQFEELWQLPRDVLETKDPNQVLAVGLTRLKDPEPFRAEVVRLRRHPRLQTSGMLEFKNGAAVEYCSKPQTLNNDITGRVWSFRVVTNAYYAQQEQKRLLQQVAAINEELTHFAYVVSHDLKAPLRGIKLLTEWLCTDYADQFDDEAKENLDLLQNRVARMHNLIEGVLQYSRVGRIKEDMVEIDLNTLLPEVIDAIVPPEHIAIRIDGPLPIVECEPTRITQIFQNLLTNAIKYMDKPAGQVVVACTENETDWTFSVSDNGPGIEEKHFDRIFKIFQTLAPRDEFESTGVGLTLVKKIVEYYGGRIWVVSEVGRGSTFFFTLPKRKAVASTEEPTPAVACGSRSDENETQIGNQPD